MLGEVIPTMRGHGEKFQETSPPNPMGSSMHRSGVLRHLEISLVFDAIAAPGETEWGFAGTQPDQGYPGRLCAHDTRDPWLKTWMGVTLCSRHGKPELCLKNSILGSAETLPSAHRFSRGSNYLRLIQPLKESSQLIILRQGVIIFYIV
jgi:hypothetical protein